MWEVEAFKLCAHKCESVWVWSGVRIIRAEVQIYTELCVFCLFLFFLSLSHTYTKPKKNILTGEHICASLITILNVNKETNRSLCVTLRIPQTFKNTHNSDTYILVKVHVPFSTFSCSKMQIHISRVLKPQLGHFNICKSSPIG